jgi:sugar phosphate isomerase/epimerase/phosphoglycolate phosphatase-like HAD superfamily hydrolase
MEYAQRFEILRGIAKKNGITRSKTDSEYIVEFYKIIMELARKDFGENIDAWCADGAKELAAQLAVLRPGLQMYVVTANVQEQFKAIVGNFSIHNIFDGILGHPLKMNADNPRNKTAILRKLESKAARKGRHVVFFGDSPSDVEFAKKAGVLIIGVANNPDNGIALIEKGADVIITSLKPAKALMDLLGLNRQEDGAEKSGECHLREFPVNETEAPEAVEMRAVDFGVGYEGIVRIEKTAYEYIAKGGVFRLKTVCYRPPEIKVTDTFNKDEDLAATIGKGELRVSQRQLEKTRERIAGGKSRPIEIFFDESKKRLFVAKGSGWGYWDHNYDQPQAKEGDGGEKGALPIHMSTLKIGRQNLRGVSMIGALNKTIEEEGKVLELAFWEYDQPNDYGRAIRELIKDKANKHGISLQVHASKVDVLNEQDRSLIIDCVVFAYDIGAKLVTVHITEPGQKYLFAMEAIFKKAKELGITLGLENTRLPKRGNWHTVSEINNTFEYLKEEYRDTVGLTFDLGHCYTQSAAEFLKGLDKKIRILNVHVHGGMIDAAGEETHVAFSLDERAGDMEFVIKELLSMGYTGAFIIEVPADDFLLDKPVLSNIFEKSRSETVSKSYYGLSQAKEDNKLVVSSKGEHTQRNGDMDGESPDGGIDLLTPVFVGSISVRQLRKTISAKGHQAIKKYLTEYFHIKFIISMFLIFLAFRLYFTGTLSHSIEYSSLRLVDWVYMVLSSAVIHILVSVLFSITIEEYLLTLSGKRDIIVGKVYYRIVGVVDNFPYSKKAVEKLCRGFSVIIHEGLYPGVENAKEARAEERGEVKENSTARKFVNKITDMLPSQEKHEIAQMRMGKKVINIDISERSETSSYLELPDAKAESISGKKEVFTMDFRNLVFATKLLYLSGVMKKKERKIIFIVGRDHVPGVINYLENPSLIEKGWLEFSKPELLNIINTYIDLKESMKISEIYLEEGEEFTETIGSIAGVSYVKRFLKQTSKSKRETVSKSKRTGEEKGREDGGVHVTGLEAIGFTKSGINSSLFKIEGGTDQEISEYNYIIEVEAFINKLSQVKNKIQLLSILLEYQGLSISANGCKDVNTLTMFENLFYKKDKDIEFLITKLQENRGVVDMMLRTLIIFAVPVSGGAPELEAAQVEEYAAEYAENQSGLSFTAQSMVPELIIRGLLDNSGGLADLDQIEKRIREALNELNNISRKNKPRMKKYTAPKLRRTIFETVEFEYSKPLSGIGQGINGKKASTTQSANSGIGGNSGVEGLINNLGSLSNLEVNQIQVISPASVCI